MARYNDKWIFVMHRERATWELRGGKREDNETILQTAERELREETGAQKFELKPHYSYSVSGESKKSFGLLCYA